MDLKKSLLIIGAVLCFIPSAFAYLDPGSGSYILQAVIAGVLGGAYAIKLYWFKIISFFKGGSDTKEEVETEEF